MLTSMPQIPALKGNFQRKVSTNLQPQTANSVTFQGRLPNGLPEVVLAPSILYEGQVTHGGIGVAVRNVQNGLNLYSGVKSVVPIPGGSKVDLYKPAAEQKYTWEPVLAKEELITVDAFGKPRTFQLMRADIEDDFIKEGAKHGKTTLLAVCDCDKDGNPIKPGDPRFSQTCFNQFEAHYFEGKQPIEGKNELQRGVDVFNPPENTPPEMLQRELTERYIMLWNQVNAEIAVKLEESLLKDTDNPGHPLKPDALISHGWHNALLPTMIKNQEGQKHYFDDKGSVYYKHVHTDIVKPPSQFPPFVQSLNIPANMSKDGEPLLSLEALILQNSDTVIANRDHTKLMAETAKEVYGTPNYISTALTNPEKVGPFLDANEPTVHFGISTFDPTIHEDIDFPVKNTSFKPLDFKGDIANADPAELKPAVEKYKKENRIQLYNMIENLNETKGFDGQVIGHLDRKEDSVIFSFLDRVDPVKTVDLTIDVFQKILDENPNVQFVFSSRTDMSKLEGSKFEKNINELLEKHPGRVVFINGQPNRKILYAGSDFGVRASLSESFGIVQLEMMRTGTPLVYYDDHGHKASMNADVGFPIAPLSPADNFKFLDYMKETVNPHIETPSVDSTIYNQVFKSYSDAVKTAAALTPEQRIEKDIACLKHIAQNHTWKSIIKERFEPPLIKAMDMAEERQKHLNLNG